MAEAKKVTIREVQMADAPLIAKLGNELLDWESEVMEIEERLAHILDKPSDYGFFVAEIDGRVVGFANVMLAMEMRSGHQARMDWVVVSESYRGQGIGKLLMAAVERWAKEHGSRSLKFTSNTHRLDAHKFYEKIGYEKRKEQFQFFKFLSEEK